MFKAMLITDTDGKHNAEIVDLDHADLPAGEVLVKVDYTCMNYKDGLAVTGKGKIIRQFPLVPGVDFAGTVLESSAPEYVKGDPVVLTGWDAGVSHFGGFSQRARVPADWLVPLPSGLSLKQSMAIGTAGVTAMLSILELEEAGIGPDKGPIIVSGASGGVGSIAVALLSSLGYQVVAVTGRQSTHDYLYRLGAAEIVSRQSMEVETRPLEKQKWAGAIDTVGGPILARILAETAERGAVACCGLAGSAQLTTTVMPFILRGVRLIGIESVRCSKERRLQVWQRVARDLPVEKMVSITEVIGLESVIEKAEDFLANKVMGRIVIDVNL